MIGPLLAAAAPGVAGVPLHASGRLRNPGQGAMGVALGLYFTPAVAALLLTLAPALAPAVAVAVAVGAARALLMGCAFYRCLLHFNAGLGVDRPTAFFAAAIGGACEMAVPAERQHAQVNRVAAAHSLRMLLVVVLAGAAGW